MSLSLHPVPEIQRVNVAQVVLQLKVLGVASPMDFPYISPPSTTVLKLALEMLFLLGALNKVHNYLAILWLFFWSDPSSFLFFTFLKSLLTYSFIILFFYLFDFKVLLISLLFYFWQWTLSWLIISLVSRLFSPVSSSPSSSSLSIPLSLSFSNLLFSPHHLLSSHLI